MKHKCFLCGIMPVEKQGYVCLVCSIESIQQLTGYGAMQLTRLVKGERNALPKQRVRTDA